MTGDAAKGVLPLPDAEIAREVTIMIAAGTDTTATALAYLFFELARHPEWYARLRAEVFAAAPAPAAVSANNNTPAAGGTHSNKGDVGAHGAHDVGGGACGGPLSEQHEQQQQQQQQLPPYATLKSLPVLNAVVWETLRMHPAIIGALLREAPRGGAPVTVLAAGGAGGGRGMTGGSGVVWVPAGTTVSAQAYTLQRNPHAFPQPDVWQPARWLARAASPAVPLYPAAASALPSSSSCPLSSSSEPSESSRRSDTAPGTGPATSATGGAANASAAALSTTPPAEQCDGNSTVACGDGGSGSSTGNISETADTVGPREERGGNRRGGGNVDGGGGDLSAEDYSIY